MNEALAPTTTGPTMQSELERTAALAGRWQIPLALVAVVVAAAAFQRAAPRSPTVDFDRAMEGVRALEAAGMTRDAADAAANLLDVRPPLTAAQQAVLHDFLADLIYRQEEGRENLLRGNVERLIEHHEAAVALGTAPGEATALRAAFAYRAVGNAQRAIATYRQAYETPPSADQRRAAAKALVQLLEGQPESRAEREQILGDLLEDDSVSIAYVWWGLLESMRQALGEQDVARARLLLDHYGDRLRSSDLRGYAEYLEALLLVSEGRIEQAAPIVEWVEQWLATSAHPQRDLNRFGYLPSMNQCLGGRIHLLLQEPERALADYDAAVRAEPMSELYVEGQVGRGRALAALGRHDEAAIAFRDAIARQTRLTAARPDAQGAIAGTLQSLFEDLQSRGAHADALRYLELVAALVPEADAARHLDISETLAKAYRLAAEELRDPDWGRDYHAQSGRWFDRAAALAGPDEPRRAALLWSAAEEFDRAAELADARRAMLEFLDGRKEDPRVPLAMLHVGRTCEALGDLEAALGWYGGLIDRYPALEDAARARVLSAGCLLSLGPERFAEAERLLNDVLGAANLTPDALVFRDAHESCCDLLYQQRRYSEAISRLEDFLVLYPRDANRHRAHYTLADCYRRSAYDLRDDPPATAGADEARRESRTRFIRAAELFEQLAEWIATAAESGDAEPLYRKLALFHAADCRFELNDPDSLDAALATYRLIAAQYEAEPTALNAQIQIANIHLRTGNAPDAARAIERARWLLRGMRDESLAASPAGRTRADWERFLTTVASSNLFRDLLASAR